MRRVGASDPQRIEVPSMCQIWHTAELILDPSRLPHCRRIPAFMLAVYGYQKETPAVYCLVSAYQGENYHDENFDRSGRNACIRNCRWGRRSSASAARL